MLEGRGRALSGGAEAGQHQTPHCLARPPRLGDASTLGGTFSLPLPHQGCLPLDLGVFTTGQTDDTFLPIPTVQWQPRTRFHRARCHTRVWLLPGMFQNVRSTRGAQVRGRPDVDSTQPQEVMKNQAPGSAGSARTPPGLPALLREQRLGGGSPEQRDVCVTVISRDTQGPAGRWTGPLSKARGLQFHLLLSRG